jgi:membrane protein implicated in regulation of membrane protease activity
VTALLVVGGIGLAILVLSFVLDEAIGGLFDSVGLDSGSGLFSAPVIGAFFAAAGFGGALAMSAMGGGPLVGAAGGLVSGVAFAAVALAVTRALMGMRTDDNVRLADLVGRPATVVTRIPEGGLGEVAVTHLGQRLKLNARSADPIPAGTAVVITAVTSSTSVVVDTETSFWGTAEHPNQLGGA